MFVKKEIKAQVEQKLRDCIAIAERRYGITIKFPTVVYHKRGTTAGTADYRKWVIDINPVLLNENVDEMISDTVPHELAHLIDYQLHPENFNSTTTDRFGRTVRAKRSVHGPTWKAIMVTLGCNPSRCHSFDTSNARVKRKAKHTWTCKCGAPMELGPKRHVKMLRGIAKYWMRGHASCGGYTYGAAPRTMVANPAPKPTRAAPNTNTAGKSTKELAIEVYAKHPQRGEFIQMMMDLGVKKVTASTYHHNVKSGKWG